MVRAGQAHSASVGGEQARTGIRGALVSLPPQISPARFDRLHEAVEGSTLLPRLSAQAFGVNWPAEVDPFGGTTWWTLGRFISGLRVGPDELLVDLACGRGGVGLWLARATGARLIGVDFSAAAVRAAAARAPRFVPVGRAQFEVGELTDSGLPNALADGVVCVDAVFFAADRVAAVAEIGRLLRPGRRAMVTAVEIDNDRPGAVPDWRPIVEAGGLRVVDREVTPGFPEQVLRMYELWLAHADELGAELGEEVAAGLLEEARHVGPMLPQATAWMYTLERP